MPTSPRLGFPPPVEPRGLEHEPTAFWHGSDVVGFDKAGGAASYLGPDRRTEETMQENTSIIPFEPTFIGIDSTSTEGYSCIYYFFGGEFFAAWSGKGHKWPPFFARMLEKSR